MPRLRVQFGGVIAVNGAWSNTLEFQLGSTITNLSTLQTIASACQGNTALRSAVAGVISSDTSLVNTKMLYYPDGATRASLVAVSTGAAIVGSSTANYTPQVAVVASLRTDYAGRSARGRTYVPYRSAGITNGGVVTTTGVTAVVNYVNALKSGVIAACANSGITAAWGVWSPKTSVFRPITSILVGSQCDTVRHRVRNRAETYTVGTVTATSIAAIDQDDLDRLLKVAADAKVIGINQALQDAPAFLQSVIDVFPAPGFTSAGQERDDEEDAAASVAAQSNELDDEGDDQS